MKKYISMLLCAAVLTASVTGCASNEVQSGNAPAAGGDVIAETTEQGSETVTSPAQTPVTTTAATNETAIESEPTTPEETTVPEETLVPEETTVPVETNEVVAVEPEDGDSTASVPPVSTTMADTSKPVSDITVPEQVENEAPEEYEYVPLTANDIYMEIKTDGVITTDTERFTVEFTYIGDEECEYCFGCDYSLKKWDNAKGDWADVKFSENAAWNALGYIIGKDSPKNSITVSLSDDFYAEPLTAGSYLLVKNICDGVVLEQTFEIKSVDNGVVIESESGTLTLVINEIAEDKLVCSLAWPYPATYEVMCDTSEYSDFCVGDTIEVKYAPMYKIEDFLFRVTPELIAISDFEMQEGVDYKPVIYLYPEEETEVSVKLCYNGELIVTEPIYGDGWNVTAYPDGRIFSDGEEYPYLFWEGEKAYELDKSAGFCVSGEDTESFLREKLSFLGLNEDEAADFLEFWLPHMEKNAYNIIRFHSEDYTDNAVLDISPVADTVIRVYMTFEAVDEYTDIAPQSLEAAPERSGFTVVEWGGSIG